jgi:hypothetical protein
MVAPHVLSFLDDDGSPDDVAIESHRYSRMAIIGVCVTAEGTGSPYSLGTELFRLPVLLVMQFRQASDVPRSSQGTSVLPIP